MPSLNERLVNLAFVIIAAVAIGAGGWAFTVNSKVAAMEAQQVAMAQMTQRMMEDIRHIRNMVEDELRRQRDNREH